MLNGIISSSLVEENIVLYSFPWIAAMLDSPTRQSFKDLIGVWFSGKFSTVSEKYGMSRSWSSINTGLNWSHISSRTDALNFWDRSWTHPLWCLATTIYFSTHVLILGGKKRNPTVGKAIACRNSRRLVDDLEHPGSSRPLRMAGNTMASWRFIGTCCNASWAGTTGRCEGNSNADHLMSRHGLYGHF